MIEFTSDSPFSPTAEPLFPDRVRIVGLGQNGIAAIDQLLLHGRGARDLWAFDTDQQTIEGSIVPNRHLLGRDIVRGLGCGGDRNLAREIAALEALRLAPVAHDCDFLVLILSLAGATGVALAEHLAEIARQSGIKVIVLGVKPFAFEGPARRALAQEAAAVLRQRTDAVLVLAQDRLAQSASALKNVRNGFHLMHRLLAQATPALAQVVAKRGLVQLSFADLRSLYGRYDGAEVLENCWIGHVEWTSEDDSDDLVAELLSGPLLADTAIWQLADHAIVTVSGCQDLGLADVQEIIGVLKEQLPVKLPLVVSANLDEESPQVRLTLFLATTAPAAMPVPVVPEPMPVVAAPSILKEAPAAPAVPVTSVRRKPRPGLIATPPVSITPLIEEPAREALAETPPAHGRSPTKQEEMIFEGPARGRFEKTHETIYRGENLDQPTFRRRRLPIRA